MQNQDFFPCPPVHSTARSFSGLNTTGALLGTDFTLMTLSPSIINTSPLMVSKQSPFFCLRGDSTPGSERHSHQVLNKNHQVLTAGGQLSFPYKTLPRHSVELYYCHRDKIMTVASDRSFLTVPRECWEFAVCEKEHNAMCVWNYILFSRQG